VRFLRTTLISASISSIEILKFRHKKGEEVAGGQMAGLRGAAVWFLRKTERSVDEVRPRVNFLRELEG